MKKDGIQTRKRKQKTTTNGSNGSSAEATTVASSSAPSGKSHKYSKGSSSSSGRKSSKLSGGNSSAPQTVSSAPQMPPQSANTSLIYSTHDHNANPDMNGIDLGIMPINTNNSIYIKNANDSIKPIYIRSISNNDGYLKLKHYSYSQTLIKIKL